MTENGKLKKEYFEVLQEELRSNFKLAFEGQEILRRELQETKDTLRAEIKMVDDKLSFFAKTTNKRFEEIDKRFDKVYKMIAETRNELSSKIDGLSEKIESHERRLVTLES